MEEVELLSRPITQKKIKYRHPSKGRVEVKPKTVGAYRIGRGDHVRSPDMGLALVTFVLIVVPSVLSLYSQA